VSSHQMVKSVNHGISLYSTSSTLFLETPAESTHSQHVMSWGQLWTVFYWWINLLPGHPRQ